MRRNRPGSGLLSHCKACDKLLRQTALSTEHRALCRFRSRRAGGATPVPIFLDRHDLSGLTASDIAEAHRKDLEVQEQYGVRFLTYWFDESRGPFLYQVPFRIASAIARMSQASVLTISKASRLLPYSASIGVDGRHWRRHDAMKT